MPPQRPVEPLQIRPVDPDSEALAAFVALQQLVFGYEPAPSPERVSAIREATGHHRRTAAFDGDGTLVATYRSYDTSLTVPGGTVTANAISSVTVRPTHRRRGALTALITADLAEAAARGLPVAILIASEAAIYGRFGFAPATLGATWEVDLPAAQLRPGVRREGSVEIVPEAALRDLAPAAYERARRPGAIDRTDDWWDRSLGISPRPGEQHTPAIGVVHRDPGGVVQGFARYSAKPHWEARLTQTWLTVHALVAATPDAHAALWGYLLEQDLASGVRAEDLAVDDPLPWLLTDGRRARLTSRSDFQWSRLLDVPAALSARRYEGPAGTVRFAVDDPLGWAAGRYTLAVDATGAGTCVRDQPAAAGPAADPAVTLDVAALSSCWLGGGDLLAAAMAGQTTEHVPGAVAALASMLRTARAPWTSTWF